MDKKTIRFCAVMILFAIGLRLHAGGFFHQCLDVLTGPKVRAFLLYAGTGMVYVPPEQTTVPPETVPEETQPLPSFSPDDATLLHITNYPDYTLDVPAMLTAPLSWDLTTEAPSVLIVHTHACEGYEGTADYRTTDKTQNMVSVGEALAQSLRSKGIAVLHDTTLHDDPYYNGAYFRCRDTIEQYLQQYPSIQMVIDLHRDAYTDSSGNQASGAITVNGVTTSRLMFLVGTDADGWNHPDWSQNLSTALKLQTILEKKYPGLCRPICMRSSAFNQDLSRGMLLIEVGTAGDQKAHAVQAVQFLSEGIAALSHGSN